MHLVHIAFGTELFTHPYCRGRILKIPHLLADEPGLEFLVDLVRQELVARAGEPVTLFLR